VSDDVRSADPQFQSLVDQKIRGALDAWRIDHVEIDVTLPAAVDEAADVVKRILAG
jgi:hypothetical protein